MRKYELVLVSGEGCIYCKMSKGLLDDEGLGYRMVDYKTFPKFKEDGHLTIPQIYLFNRTDATYQLLKDGYQGLLDTDMEELRATLHEETTID